LGRDQSSVSRLV